ncbi:response regulator [Nannocystis sp. ILAH1]|uniref:response regulator transcription factor n=1 Tax=unclassified Nannocystis TaxID=2627009 RepID=UPI002270D7E5|nr:MULTISPECIES: response regulator [unclassified Nannocystis]MCY0986263.1 response regulator [Nannocystis sp. ILAH1]MCY1068858.1 response regulator [Nannocystis sp. RBIL2]
MPTKILAIDDSKTMRLAIKITFAAEDYDVVAVSKGSEAVARAKQMPADVLIVDAALAAGEPSGYEVVKAVRADPDTAHIPVLLLVSNQVGIDEAQVQACGANGAMTKPFDTQEMLEKVTALAQGKSITSGKTVPKAAPAPQAAAPVRPAPAAAPSPVAAAPTPAARPVQAPSTPPAAAPKPTPAATPAAAARPAATPASSGNKNFPAAFASGEDMASKIPIATPIPFAPADAPTAGMLKRLQAAGGAGTGLDPKAVQALLSLSRDVIEQVVWEVVPDMAEQILARGQQARH